MSVKKLPRGICGVLVTFTYVLYWVGGLCLGRVYTIRVDVSFCRCGMVERCELCYY